MTNDNPIDNSQELPTAAPPPRRRRRGLRIILKCLAGLAVIVVIRLAWLGILLAMGGKPPTLGRDTTYVTEPLRADGTVDYLAAWNALASQGITPENNAAVPLTQVLGYWECDGVDSAGRKDREAPCVRLLAAVGAPPLPREERLRPFNEFFDAAQNPDAPDPWDEYSEAYRAPWKPQQLPIAHRAYTANNKAIDRIVAASRLSKYHVPRYTVSSDGMMLAMLLPDISSMKEASRQLLGRGMLALGEGRHAAAADDFMACHRLARLMAQEPVLLCWLVGVGIDGLAMQGDAALANYGGLTTEQLADYRRRLRELPPLSPLAEKFEGERLLLLDIMTAVIMRRTDLNSLSGHDDSSRGSVFMRLVDADEMLRVGNTACDELAQANDLSTYTEREAALEQVGKKWTALARNSTSASNIASRIATGSPRHAARDLGNMLVALLLPPISACAEHERLGELRRALTNVAMEVAAYRAEHGKYPETLAALGPQFTELLHQDLFRGSPPEYQRTEQGYSLRVLGVQKQGAQDDYWIEIEMPIPPRKVEE